MSKQQINHKQTNVATQGGVGQQVEVSYTVSDSTLPSPQELADYQRINPNIVKFLMETAQKEQQHRPGGDARRIPPDDSSCRKL